MRRLETVTACFLLATEAKGPDAWPFSESASLFGPPAGVMKLSPAHCRTLNAGVALNVSTRLKHEQFN